MSMSDEINRQLDEGTASPGVLAEIEKQMERWRQVHEGQPEAPFVRFIREQRERDERAAAQS